jgi:hypothetical protein
MPRKVIPLPEWIPQACELMVKYDLSLRQAAAELGQDISIEEAEALKDRKLFKEALEQARLANYSEIGAAPCSPRRLSSAKSTNSPLGSPQIMRTIRLPTPSWEGLFADAALPAFLGTVLAILAVLAGVAGIGTRAGRCENVERKLTDEKN